MRIIEIDNYSDFLNLEKEWNSLLKRCNNSVFSKWEWLSTWWKHFGSDRRLVILLATDNNEIIGIAPLMHSPQKLFGLRRGKIAFIGTPHTDYNDFIIPGKVKECLRLFIDYLNNLPEKWNYLELNEIPENSKSIAFLGNFSKTINPFSICPYIPLPKSINAFRARLSKNMRRNLRRKKQRIENSYKIEFADYSRVGSCTDGMNWLFKLNQKRWTSKGLPGAFANRKFRNFHLDVAKSFAQKDLLGLYLLKLSDKPVAAVYGFKDQTKYYSYLSGFDPDYSQYGVGNQLFEYVMCNCIEDGLLEFDFMRGGELHKFQWKALSRWNRGALITRSGLFSNIQYLIFTKIWDYRKRLMAFSDDKCDKD